MGKMKEHSTDYNVSDYGDFYDQQMDTMLWGVKDAIIGKPLDVDANLKTAAAAGKPKMSDVPPVALFALGAAMSDGAKKYGRFNWRETGSTSSVFYDAMMRHLVDWYNGESYADDSKIHHLAHLMASCAIVLDSELHGRLLDDRKKNASISRNPSAWRIK